MILFLGKFQIKNNKKSSIFFIWIWMQFFKKIFLEYSLLFVVQLWMTFETKPSLLVHFWANMLQQKVCVPERRVFVFLEHTSSGIEIPGTWDFLKLFPRFFHNLMCFSHLGVVHTRTEFFSLWLVLSETHKWDQNRGDKTWQEYFSVFFVCYS